MSSTDRHRWDAKYAEKPIPERLIPDDWLREQIVDLPPGRALEPACGLGHNSIWLAQHGWQVDAVDISSVGLAQAEKLAEASGAQVNWIAADLDIFEPEPAVYDLILVFRFLERRRLPGLLQRSLRPGGRLLYETFTTAHLDRPDSQMTNPAFALTSNELPRLFPGLDVICYAECTLVGRNVARMVGKKSLFDSTAGSLRPPEASAATSS